MARGLLLAMVMETPPGQVIRTLREALQMSQAEFARALDWSPSTISAWERGRAEPNRLAFKVILAFAEGRGVRYRPRAATRSLAPVAREPIALAAPAVPALLPRERFVTVTADRPRWSAEATFRVSRPAAAGERRIPGSALGTLGVAVATLCAGLALGLPGNVRLAASRPAPRVTTPAPHGAHDVARSAAPASVMTSTGTHERVVPAAAPALARLDGLVLVGGRHHATFRTDDDSVTVPEGSHLGTQRVAAIARDRVELIDPHGDTRTVRLGHHATLE